MATLRAVSARKLHALFQHAREPIFLLDASRRIVFVNRAWEELTGRGSELVSGLICEPPLSSGEPLAELASAFCPPAESLLGQPAMISSLIPGAEGQRQLRQLEFWPLFDARDRLLGLLGFVHSLDIRSLASPSPSGRLRAELAEIRERLRTDWGQVPLLGQGPAHRRLLEQVETAARSRCPLLIRGEPGTGKRLVARSIHQQGVRPEGLFVTVDVQALSPGELHRELFARPDWGDRPTLNVSSAASLAIGDVVDLPRDIQERMVQALEHTDDAPRIMGMSAHDPELARRDDRLREDLYFALTTLVIRLQPLRARLEELPLLAQGFLERLNARAKGRKRWGFEPGAIEVLRSYDWPGNMAELSRVIETAYERASGDLISESDLPAEIRGSLGAAYAPPPMPVSVTPLDRTLETVERRLIEQALAKARRNKSKAAELLDISRPRLYRRIKELNIPDDPDGSGEGTNA